MVYLEKVAFYHHRGKQENCSSLVEGSTKIIKEDCKVNNVILDAIVTVISTLNFTYYDAVIYNKRKGWSKNDYIKLVKGDK